MAATAFWRASQYVGSGDWIDESGNGHDGTLAGPVFLQYVDAKYMYKPDEGNSNYASTPDSAVLDIVGDIELSVFLACPDWTPTNDFRRIMGKFLAAGNHQSYRLRLRTSGVPTASWDTWGGAGIPNEDCTAATGVSNGSRKWVRWTLDVDNGASGYDCKFFLGDDGSNWTQLGTTVVGGATTVIASRDGNLLIGLDESSATGGLIAKYYRARVYNGIAGTLVFDALFNDAVEPYATFTEQANSAVVTINRAATGLKTSICDRDLFLFGADDHIGVAHHAELDFAAADDFSLAGMLRVYDETPAAAMVLAGKKDDLTTAAGYSAYLDTDAKIKMVIDDTVQDPVVVETAAISPGYATMWGFSRDADGNLRGYINGVASGSPVADTTTATLANARPFRMGASSHATPASHLDGEIMSCALFRSVLSPAAMWALNEEFRATTLPLLRKARYQQMMRGQ